MTKTTAPKLRPILTLRLPDVPPPQRRLVHDALHSLDAAVRAVCGADAGPPDDARGSAASVARLNPAALLAVCRMDDFPRLFEEALEKPPERAHPYMLATLVWALDRPATRDIALVQWRTDRETGDAAALAQARWEGGAEYPPELGELMWGSGPAPDMARLRTALTLARRVAALAPPERRAGPLAVCAWLCWAQGRIGEAAVHAHAACRHESEHGLAQIVRSFIAIGHHPDWDVGAGAA